MIDAQTPQPTPDTAKPIERRARFICGANSSVRLDCPKCSPVQYVDVTYTHGSDVIVVSCPQCGDVIREVSLSTPPEVIPPLTAPPPTATGYYWLQEPDGEAVIVEVYPPNAVSEPTRFAAHWVGSREVQYLDHLEPGCKWSARLPEPTIDTSDRVRKPLTESEEF